MSETDDGCGLSNSSFRFLNDDSLSNGLTLVQAILGQCDHDLNALYGEITPAAASLPFEVSLVPGGAGASRPGCTATTITCYIDQKTH